MVGRGSPAYVTLLVLHVLSAFVGFGAVVLTGIYAAILERHAHDLERRRDTGLPGAARQYFGGSRNWPARTIYLVPVLGAALIPMSNGVFGFGQAWLAGSLGLWVVAILTAQLMVWPGEARVQVMLRSDLQSRRGAEDLNGERVDELRSVCRRVVSGSAWITAAGIAALALMFLKP